MFWSVFTELLFTTTFCHHTNSQIIAQEKHCDRKNRPFGLEAVYLGNPMRHDEKYLLINQGFAGKQRLMPFFNRQNNDDLILAIQAAGMSRGRNGFKEDKGGEKLAESEEDLLEYRTDGTDAFDTLYIGCEKFPYRDAFSINVTGVI